MPLLVSLLVVLNSLCFLFSDLQMVNSSKAVMEFADAIYEKILHIQTMGE